MMRKWRQGLIVLFVLLLTVASAAAFETDERAQAAYGKIDAAVAQEYGRDSSTELANFPEGFGGAWLDEENYLIIGLTEEAEMDQEYYRELSEDPEVLKFVDVKYSLADLLKIQAEISQSYPEMEGVDFYLEGALIDLASNTVQLTVMQGGLETALVYYTGLYGDAISGVEGQEAIESGNLSGETTQGLVVSIWVVVAVLAAVLAAIVLVVILVVLLIQNSRKKKRQKKEAMAQAAARAAQEAKSRKKK